MPSLRIRHTDLVSYVHLCCVQLHSLFLSRHQINYESVDLEGPFSNLPASCIHITYQPWNPWAGCWWHLFWNCLMWLWKFSMTSWMELAGFSRGAWLYFSFLQRVSTVVLTCQAVLLSSCASSKEVTTRPWFCLLCIMQCDTLLVIAMISHNKGRVQDMNLLNQQSIWQDWALKHWNASDPAHMEPQDVELWRWPRRSGWSSWFVLELDLLLLVEIWNGWMAAKTLVPPTKEFCVNSFVYLISSMVALLPLPLIPPALEGM